VERGPKASAARPEDPEDAVGASGNQDAAPSGQRVVVDRDSSRRYKGSLPIFPGRRPRSPQHLSFAPTTSLGDM